MRQRLVVMGARARCGPGGRQRDRPSRQIPQAMLPGSTARLPAAPAATCCQPAPTCCGPAVAQPSIAAPTPVRRRRPRRRSRPKPPAPRPYVEAPRGVGSPCAGRRAAPGARRPRSAWRSRCCRRRRPAGETGRSAARAVKNPAVKPAEKPAVKPVEKPRGQDRSISRWTSRREDRQTRIDARKPIKPPPKLNKNAGEEGRNRTRSDEAGRRSPPRLRPKPSETRGSPAADPGLAAGFLLGSEGNSEVGSRNWERRDGRSRNDRAAALS